MSVSLVFIANGFRHANRCAAPLRFAVPDAEWRNPLGREHADFKPLLALFD
jgi:hypothetical protein